MMLNDFALQQFDSSTGGLVGSMKDMNLKIMPVYNSKSLAFFKTHRNELHYSLNDEREKALIKIQALIRGFLVRKKHAFKKRNSRNSIEHGEESLENLQIQLQNLQKKVNALELMRREDEVVIQSKSKKIEDLQRKLYSDNANDMIKSDLKCINFPLRPISKRTFIKSNSVTGCSSVSYHESSLSAGSSSVSSKSIWASLNETSVDFGLFSDVRSQPSSERAFSTNGSDLSAARNNPIGECKPIWNFLGGQPNGSADDSFFSNSGNECPSVDLTQSNASAVGEIQAETDAPVNYSYLVDRIVRTNDQPISLFLQQKLQQTKCQVTKTKIFEAITQQAVQLMKNRFGNFLMQKCFEFGTDAQIRSIVQKMDKNILDLACDRFGCHVVQRAVERVDEEMKIMIILEMSQKIKATITHRFASHVWQRIFEIKWKTPYPALYEKVNEAQKNEWTNVANDEHGSLVVQCIFENAESYQKDKIIEEILNNAHIISKGQWGNYVVQWILEHGNAEHRANVVCMLTRDFLSMSLDQYASKVIEKGLKIATKRELHVLIDQVLVSSDIKSNTGRAKILDMMNHQYANYVVQHILSLADKNQRNMCTRLLLPHVPALRSSKYGQRVAAIIEKQFRSVNREKIF